MTVAERERAAVRDHRCPRCHSQPGFRCRLANGRSLVKVQYLKHPHKQRVALVDASA
jgi:hypothetical protein